jgi:hypothetical protein
MRRLGRAALAVAAGLSLASITDAHADRECIGRAKDTYVSCRDQCKDDFFSAKFACRGVSPACGLACLAGREVCVDAAEDILRTGQFPDGSPLANCPGGTDACMSALKTAKSACGAPCAPSDAACNACVDVAQVTAFTCRDACRDSWRPDPRVVAALSTCRKSFKSCVQACPAS